MIEGQQLLDAFLKALSIPTHLPLSQHFRHAAQEMVYVEGLSNVSQGAIISGLDGAVKGGAAGDDDHRRGAVQFTGRLKDLQATDPRQKQIGDDQRKPLLTEDLQSLLATGAGEYLIMMCQNSPQQFQDRELIFNY